ncbi:MAG: EAL domain-containing protein [Lachnospiraceae bacterium]|nr:EAL domain-containing protein [Lachnospiraceae bacterium]
MAAHIVAYDYCAFILLMIIAYYYFRSGIKGSYRGAILALIIAVTVAASVCDATRVRFAAPDIGSDRRFFMVNSAYYLFFSIIPPLYLLYIIADLDLWHVLRGFLHRVVFWFAPSVAYIVILTVNFFYPAAFSVMPGRDLEPHWGYYVGQMLYILYNLLTVWFLGRFVKPIDTKRYRVFLAPVYICVTGLAVNLINPSQHVLCMAITLCILMLVLISRRTEDAIDFATGMHTYKVFAEDMTTNFKSGKKMQIILLNIVNYKYALRLVGYDQVLKMMRPVSDEILRIMRRHHAPFMCYYIGDGKFAIELSRRLSAMASSIVDEIGTSIHRNVKMEISDFELDIRTCLASCPDDISDVESLFMLISDMDQAVSNGRSLSASSITRTKEFLMKKDMSAIIDRALANHYFSVFYQPIYDTVTGKYTSAEALVRLRDPKYGYISPALFIPIAEKSGAIHAIGSFVLEEVIKFIASPDFAPLGVDYIEINLSAMQCLRNDLADEIIGLSGKYEVDPSKINLEITETASAYSQSKLYGNIRTLADHGFSFSLDDFGTGYSNLMRIASLPLNIVKLDRAFVLMEESGGHHVIIRNLIMMLKNMKLKVVVEGIETEEMVDSFIQMGADEIQGFYYSRPLTKSAYIRFIREKLTA